MKYLLILVLILAGCGGSSGGGSSSGSQKDSRDCLANYRNCTHADVDLIAPIQYAADNGIDIVHIRWAGCCDDDKYQAIAEYAYNLNVAIIWVAGDSQRKLTFQDPHVFVTGSHYKGANYGPAVDIKYERGTIHGGIHALAVAVKLYDTYPPAEALNRLITGNYVDFEPSSKLGYPDKPLKTDRTVLIVDNGFDQIRPEYVVWKNPVLATEVTGDYGVKAINELYRWLDGVKVIGYVPFNTAPHNPRVDDWKIRR